MFPDSKVAGAYAAARTKTRAIITHALAIKLMIVYKMLVNVARSLYCVMAATIS